MGARREVVGDGRWWRRQLPPPNPQPRAPVRLRSRQSRRRLRRSTRSQSGPPWSPASAARRTPDPEPPELAPVTSGCGRRGGCLRASGRGAGFSVVATRFFFSPEEQSPRASPTLGGAGGRRLPRGAPGRPGTARQGRRRLGLAQGAVPRSVLPGRRAAKLSRARGARAGAARGAARGRGARGRQAALITWPAWFSPSPGGRAGGRGVF